MGHRSSSRAEASLAANVPAIHANHEIRQDRGQLEEKMARLGRHLPDQPEDVQIARRIVGKLARCVEPADSHLAEAAGPFLEQPQIRVEPGHGRESDSDQECGREHRDQANRRLQGPGAVPERLTLR